MERIVFYDFETTGLNPFHDDIIEYSFIYYDSKKNITTLNNLINVKSRLSSKITDITGITNDMLVDKPTIQEEKDTIFNFIKNLSQGEKIYMIAHNNDHFDKFFFKRIFHNDTEKQTFIKNNVYFIDSVLLAKMVLPSMRSVSLKTLCKIFKITEGTHRAYSDTLALLSVYNELIKQLGQTMNIDYEILRKNPKIVYNIIYN
jgi:DNA polymerase III alpha subunit (gram-positive type)